MISTELLAIACGIGSAAAWGAGDFSGEMSSRKGNVLNVVLASEFLGGLFLLAVAAFSREIMPLSGAWCTGPLPGFLEISG